MKLYKLILLTSLTFFSCVDQKDKISRQVIEKLAEQDSEIPSRYSNLALFVKCGNEFACTNINILNAIYKGNKSRDKISYVNWLSDILNQKQSLTKSVLINRGISTFKLNERIIKSYRQNSLADFIKKYWDQRANTLYRLKKLQISQNEIFTVEYLMFQENYQIFDEDYTGQTFMKKWQ